MLFEALGILLGQPPQHPFKKHPFASFPCHDAQAYNDFAHNLTVTAHPQLSRFSLLGSDIDPKQIDSSQRNLHRFKRRLWNQIQGYKAGDDDHDSFGDRSSPAMPCDIDFVVGNPAQAVQRLKGRPTMILTNVPYGLLSGAHTSRSSGGWSEAIEAYSKLGRMLR